MYAIVEIAGQQFKVEKGSKLFVHRLAEAEASNLLLLHKPVPNSRLRAAMLNLIAHAQKSEDDD